MRTGREEHPRPVTSGRCRELPRVSPIPTRGRHRGARHRRTDHDDATKCLLYAELREGGESVAAIMTALRAVLEHYGRTDGALHRPRALGRPYPHLRERARAHRGSAGDRTLLLGVAERQVKRAVGVAAGDGEAGLSVGHAAAGRPAGPARAEAERCLLTRDGRIGGTTCNGG